MHTFSGTFFTLEGDQSPSVADIARGLARIPRWVGTTMIGWSVLQHSLAVAELLTAEGAREKVILAGLWHDAEEFATGDIPMPHKTESQAELGEAIRRKLWRRTLGLPYPDAATMAVVKAADLRVRGAEARVFLHPRAAEHLGLSWDLDSVDAVWPLLELPGLHPLNHFTGWTEDLRTRLGAKIR